MAKFLSFNIVNSGAATTEGSKLVNVDQISDVSYAAGTLTLSLKNTATSAIAIVLATTQDGTAGAPVNTAGSPYVDTVNRALTANPGGVKAGVSFGKDQTGGVPAPGQPALATNLQVYVQSWTYTA